MARIDKLKEEIGWLKVIFAISIATDISLNCLANSEFPKRGPISFSYSRGWGSLDYVCNYLD